MDQIRRKLRIWSHLLKKSLMENFIFRRVTQQPTHTETSQLVSICNILWTSEDFISNKATWL